MNNLNEQVSLDDSVWSRSDIIYDCFDETEDEIYFAESNPNDNDNNDSNSNREPDTRDTEKGIGVFDRPSDDINFDTATEECIELNGQNEDDIAPTIQIYKTFSLANYGKTSAQRGECALAPATNVYECQKDSYMLTDLDREEASDKSEQSKTNTTPSLGLKEEKLTYSLLTNEVQNACGDIGCHVINLESPPKTRKTSLNPKCKDIFTSTPRLSMDEHFTTSPPFSNQTVSKGNCSNFLLPTKSNFYDGSYSWDAGADPRRENFLTPVRGSGSLCESASESPHRKTLNQPSAVGGQQEIYCYERPIVSTLCETLNGTSQPDLELGPYVISDESGEYSDITSSLGQFTVDSSVDAQGTSNLVVDLNEPFPQESGIFDESFSKKSSYAEIGRHRSRGISFQVCNREPSCSFGSADKAGGTKSNSTITWTTRDGTIYSNDHRLPCEVRVFPKAKMTSQARVESESREATYYHEIVDSVKDPYMADDCGYYYRHDFNPPFCCHHNAPYAGVETWLPERDLDSALVTDSTNESSQSNAFSDQFADIFDSHDTSDIGYGVQAGAVAVKDEEETDDADETEIMPDMVSLSYDCLRERQDPTCSYFIDPNQRGIAQLAPVTLTPPPSASTTPNLAPSNRGMSEEALPLLNAWASFSSNFNSTCSSFDNRATMSSASQSDLSLPFNHSVDDHLDTNFGTYDPQLGPKRHFPSMADPIATGYSYPSSFEYSERVSRGNDQTKRRRGRSRKVQIQSDKISTSTSKSVKGTRNKREAEADCDGDGAPKREGAARPKAPSRSTKGTSTGNERSERGPRHNEPLNQRAVGIMMRWYEEHIDDPYPSKAQKAAIACEGEISVNQVRFRGKETLFSSSLA
ncbi:spiralian-tale-e homeobox protein [Plakobranchus ocellatus]|uniref:Spiralian-tale-e homeobox protein n=1 Tax=Plakobranchus ocellatus TaxID=259542 RepID=A0AAV4DP46_9GAST|nr:spiralian-tale-e homeobox protein [Plakobranchus ocellatus]